MTMSCVLCGDSNVLRSDCLDARQLERAYRQVLGVPVAVAAEMLHYYRCNHCELGFFNPVETAEPGLYERLQEISWYYMEDKFEYVVAARYLPESGRILEVGAGMGAFASVIGTDRYAGLEFNDMAIAQASRSGIHLLKQSVAAHADAGHRYAAVVSFQVLEHVAEPARFIRDCLRCLEPEGVLILAVPAHDSCIGEMVNNVLDLPPHHATHWTASTLHKVAELFELEDVAVIHEPLAEYHYALARKTLWESRLRKFIRLQSRLLDLSWRARLVARAARLLAALIPPSLAGHRGHSVVAVIRKRPDHMAPCR